MSTDDYDVPLGIKSKMSRDDYEIKRIELVHGPKAIKLKFQFPIYEDQEIF